MVQCFLEVSLSPAWRLPGVGQGPGKRWPKKKPSGSESEEKEHVEQEASSLRSSGVSRQSCSHFLGAAALPPALTLLLWPQSTQRPLGLQTRAGRTGEKGCLGESLGVQLGAVPSLTSVEPLLPCWGPS